MTIVFVYGSLLAGQGNNRLLRTARFVGPGRTAPEYTMLSLGGFPGVVSGGSTPIEGECYEVDGPTLEALDRLEGHPSFYRRTAIVLEDKLSVEFYLLNTEHVRELPIVVSGSWLKYRQGQR